MFLLQVERYLQGPVSGGGGSEQSFNQDLIIKSCDRLKHLASSWNQNSNQYNKNHVSLFSLLNYVESILLR